MAGSASKWEEYKRLPPALRKEIQISGLDVREFLGEYCKGFFLPELMIEIEPNRADSSLYRLGQEDRNAHHHFGTSLRQQGVDWWLREMGIDV